MKNKTKPLGIYLPIFVGVLLATVTVRSVALVLHFNFDTDYFTNKIMISVADYTVFAASVFFFTYIFTARKDIKLIPNFTSPATYVPSGLVSVALIFTVKALFDRSGELNDYIKYLEELASPSAISLIPTQKIMMGLLTAAAIFAALSIVHFILTALIEGYSSTKRGSFGLCTVVFLALYASFLYFSNSLPLNAPNKIVDEMAHLFAAIFFLYETRLSIGREKWRSYIAFGFIASLISAYSSIPALVVYFVKGEAVSNSIYENALMFTFFIFITARLLLTVKLTEDKECATVSALIRNAEARNELINTIPEHQEGVVEISGEELTDSEKEEHGAENDENQITIDDVENDSSIDNVENTFLQSAENVTEYANENENALPEND